MQSYKKLSLKRQSHKLIDTKSFFSKRLSFFALLLRFFSFIYIWYMFSKNSLIIIKIKKYTCTVSNYWMCLLALPYGSVGMLNEYIFCWPAIVNQLISLSETILPAFVTEEEENAEWYNHKSFDHFEISWIYFITRKNNWKNIRITHVQLWTTYSSIF